MISKFVDWMLSPVTRRFRKELDAAILNGLIEHRRLSGRHLADLCLKKD